MNVSLRGPLSTGVRPFAATFLPTSPCALRAVAPGFSTPFSRALALVHTFRSTA